MGWTLQGQFLLPGLVLQVVLEDRFDAAIGAGAEMPGAPAGRFQARSPFGFAQTNDAQARAKTLFGMGTADHDVLDQARTVRANLCRPVDNPAGRPLQVFLMGRGYGVSPKAALDAASRVEMAGCALPVLQHELENLALVM